MNRQRLLDVAIALEDAQKNEKLRENFTMKYFAYDCGTPACALGHYAARVDLQDVLEIAEDRFGDADVREISTGDPVDWDEYEELNVIGFDVATYFGILGSQCEELFGSRGCGGAKTPSEAASYIRNFVAGGHNS